MRGERRIFPITILLLVAWLLLTVRLDSPWTGHHDENGLWISAAVRNYALYDASRLGYLQVVNSGPVSEGTYDYYVHHPPLIVWSSALISELLGRRPDGSPYEAAVRLVAVFATMINIASFYVIARRLFHSPHRALLAAAAYAFTPMLLYFGRIPNHEPLALAFLMPFVAITINWLERPTALRFGAMGALAGLSIWTAWASVFMLGGIGLMVLWAGSRQHRQQIIMLGLLAALSLVAIAAYYEWQHPGAVQELTDAFLFRSSSQRFSRGTTDFTVLEYILGITAHLLQRTSFAHVILGAAGLWLIGWDRSKRMRGVTFGLLLGGVSYLIVFRNASFIHDYYKIFLVPSLSLGTVTAILTAFSSRNRRGISRYYRPVVVSLVLVSLASSVYFFVILHRSGEQTLTFDLVRVMVENTRQTDTIVTNMERENSGVEYYAFRNITWELNPVAFLESLEDHQSAVYLFCPPGRDIFEPEALADFDSRVVLEYCHLYRIQR